MLNLHALHTRVALFVPGPAAAVVLVHGRHRLLPAPALPVAAPGPGRDGRRPGEGLGEMFASDVTVVPTRTRADGADHDEFLVTFADRRRE